MRHCVLLSCALVLIACAARPSRASLHPALWTDEDRYSASMEDACADYEQALREVEAMRDASPDRAFSSATALSMTPFNSVLEHALVRRGLSLRGIETYDHYHPGFLSEQHALYQGRIEAVHARASELTQSLDHQRASTTLAAR
jgi:hypothetical protein